MIINCQCQHLWYGRRKAYISCCDHLRVVGARRTKNSSGPLTLAKKHLFTDVGTAYLVPTAELRRKSMSPAPTLCLECEWLAIDWMRRRGPSFYDVPERRLQTTRPMNVDKGRLRT